MVRRAKLLSRVRFRAVGVGLEFRGAALCAAQRRLFRERSPGPRTIGGLTIAWPLFVSATIRVQDFEV